ncbi:kinase-like domain-containing protein [Hyaloraphidium curvatum]|nr:kinase-like domain-containing protein [Hyaloraphidium curvatum]
MATRGGHLVPRDYASGPFGQYPVNGSCGGILVGPAEDGLCYPPGYSFCHAANKSHPPFWNCCGNGGWCCRARCMGNGYCDRDWCPEPYARCDGTFQGRGCCYDLQSDVKHCGACGNECPNYSGNGVAYCSKGECKFQNVSSPAPLVRQVAAGLDFSVVLLADGTVRAFGRNDAGQSTVPEGLGDVLQVAAGHYVAAALVRGGRVVAWGNVQNHSLELVAANARSIACGVSSVAVVYDNASLRVFGAVHPVPSTAGEYVRQAVDSESFAAALLDTGEIKAWTSQSSSEGVSEAWKVAHRGAHQFCLGSAHGVALLGDGSVVAWGTGVGGQTDVVRGIENRTHAVICGFHFSIAHLVDGSVRFWGSHPFRLEDYRTLKGLTQISAGMSHVLGIAWDGRIRGWGSNSSGQLAIPAELLSDGSAGEPLNLFIPSWTGTSSFSTPQNTDYLFFPALYILEACLLVIMFSLPNLVGIWRRSRRRKGEEAQPLLERADSDSEDSTSEAPAPTAAPISQAMVFTKDQIKDLTQVLGQPGGFGTVYRGTLLDDHHPGGREVAVKVLDRGGKLNAKAFRAECGAWERLGHENVLSLIGICEDPPMLVSEVASHGDLGRFLKCSLPPPDSATVTRLVAGVASGMEYLHRRGFLHRDLKPDNVLVAERIGGPVALLSDFGLARFERGMRTASRLRASGTPGYVPPELRTGGNWSPQADAYSFGMMCYVVATGFSIPPQSVPLPPARPPRVSDALWDIIRRCLDIARSNRPNFDEIARRFRTEDVRFLDAAAPDQTPGKGTSPVVTEY